MINLLNKVIILIKYCICSSLHGILVIILLHLRSSAIGSFLTLLDLVALQESTDVKNARDSIMKTLDVGGVPVMLGKKRGLIGLL